MSNFSESPLYRLFWLALVDEAIRSGKRMVTLPNGKKYRIYKGLQEWCQKENLSRW